MRKIVWTLLKNKTPVDEIIDHLTKRNGYRTLSFDRINRKFSALIGSDKKRNFCVRLNLECFAIMVYTRVKQIFAGPQSHIHVFVWKQDANMSYDLVMMRYLTDVEMLETLLIQYRFDLCPICLEDMNPNSISNPIEMLRVCGHTFHYECICEWARKKNRTLLDVSVFPPICIFEMKQEKMNLAIELWYQIWKKWVTFTCIRFIVISTVPRNL